MDCSSRTDNPHCAQIFSALNNPASLGYVHCNLVIVLSTEGKISDSGISDFHDIASY